MRGMGLLYSVGHPQQRKGMLLPAVMRAVALIDALKDCTPRDGTVRADVIGIGLSHLAKDGPSDFHRRGEVLGLDAPGAVVPRAALDGVHRGSGQPFENFARLLADVLHARVTRNVVADLTQRHLEILPEQAVL